MWLGNQAHDLDSAKRVSSMCYLVTLKVMKEKIRQLMHMLPRSNKQRDTGIWTPGESIDMKAIPCLEFLGAEMIFISEVANLELF